MCCLLLIDGEPLIGKLDVDDNLDERGLENLGNWNNFKLLQAIKKVYDPRDRD